MRYFQDAVDEATGRGLVWGFGIGLVTGAGVMLSALIVGGALR